MKFGLRNAENSNYAYLVVIARRFIGRSRRNYPDDTGGGEGGGRITVAARDTVASETISVKVC